MHVLTTYDGQGAQELQLLALVLRRLMLCSGSRLSAGGTEQHCPPIAHYPLQELLESLTPEHGTWQQVWPYMMMIYGTSA